MSDSESSQKNRKDKNNEESESRSQSNKSSHSSHSKNSKNSDEESKIDKLEVSKEFQENVVKFVKFDDLIKKKQKELNELKSQKKPCEEYIIKHLEKLGEDQVEITGGKIKKNKAETKSALNQDLLKDAISEKVKDEKTVEEIIKLVDSMREINTHFTLKRLAGKQRAINKNKKPAASK